MFQETNYKLKQIIQAKNPNLGEDEIDKIAGRISEIGLFLVRLWLKQHSKHLKPRFYTELESKTGKPPPQ